MHSAMTFSDDAGDFSRRSRFSPPDNEAPAAIAASGVIGRSADAAILLLGLSRYTDGLQVDLAVRRRLDPEPTDHLHATLDAGLLVGVELADGRTAVAGHRHRGRLACRGRAGALPPEWWRRWSGVVELPLADARAAARTPRRSWSPARASGSTSRPAPSMPTRSHAAADKAEILWPREPDQVRHRGPADP